jgi:hypothetical protein
MTDAAFKIGQVVAFGRGPNDGHIDGNEFTIVRVMALENGLRSYRVRSANGQERIREETQFPGNRGHRHRPS